MGEQFEKKRKRIGRPTKPPKAGERVPLGLRVTPQMKKQLERAAIKNGRSLSQEAEFRLERSLNLSRHWVMAHDDRWSPVLIHKGDLLIVLGGVLRNYPMLPGTKATQRIITAAIEEDELKLLQNYFEGAPYPYDYSNEEISEAGQQWVEMQIDLARGK